MRNVLFILFTLTACSATDIFVDAGFEGGGLDPGDSSVMATVDGQTQQQRTAFLRVAALAPPLPSVDFCLRAKDATYFDGPYFWVPKGDGGAVDAGGAASFPGVSRYVQVPALGTTEVAIVSAGQGSCLSPKLTGTITIDPNKRLTVAIMGATKSPDSGARGLALQAFVDDTQGKSGLARLRVIHAALGTDQTPGLGPISASVAVGNAVVPVAVTIQPRQASAPSNTVPVVDALGYTELKPLQELGSLRLVGVPQGGPWSTAPIDLSLSDGAVRTAFIVSSPPYLTAVLCTDLASGGDTGCTTHAVK